MPNFIYLILILSLTISCATTWKEIDCSQNTATQLAQLSVKHKYNHEISEKLKQKCQLTTEDQAAYNLQRSAELKAYCTKENGYNSGFSGLQNPLICPVESSLLYYKAHQIGYRISQKKSELHTLLGEYSRASGARSIPQLNNLARSRIRLIEAKQNHLEWEIENLRNQYYFLK